MPARLALLSLAAALLVLAPAASQHPAAWARTTVQSLLDAREAAPTVDGAPAWGAFDPLPCALCDGEKTMPCRACRAGEHGAAENCAECRGRARVPCERCAGTGETLDPFAAMPCPSCGARARIPCRICLGVGRWDVIGGGTPSCVPCGARGGQRCSTCGGQRRIAVATADRTPLHEVAADARAAEREEFDALRQDCEEFLELVRRTRPKPTEPADLVEPFAVLMKAAADIDRVWRREPRTLDAIAASVRKYRAAGTFSMRSLDHPTLIRLEYRRSAEGLAVWIDYHLALIAKCEAAGEG